MSDLANFSCRSRKAGDGGCGVWVGIIVGVKVIVTCEVAVTCGEQAMRIKARIGNRIFFMGCSVSDLRSLEDFANLLIGKMCANCNLLLNGDFIINLDLSPSPFLNGKGSLLCDEPARTLTSVRGWGYENVDGAESSIG
jgi:hypothetical protein